MNQLQKVLWQREWEYAYSGVKAVLGIQDVWTELINKAKQNKLHPRFHLTWERLDRPDLD